MSDKVTRCKVTCGFKQETQYGTLLSFNPVITGSEENKRFFAATPGGQFNFYTVNSDAAAHFEIGKEYYFDIIPATATGSDDQPPH